MGWFERKSLLAGPGILISVLVAGCGTPGAPQPPSLNLPDPVSDLSAIRAGGQVRLTWTMPKHNTDKTAIRGDVPVVVCRREGTSPCDPVGSAMFTAPAKPAEFVDNLPEVFANGTPRPVSYFVELRNRKGHSAGLSNAANVLAGAAPRPIEGLKAEVGKNGVVLGWIPDGETTAVRLERRRMGLAQKRPHEPLAPAEEQASQNLLVETSGEKSKAIDKTARFGEAYQYRAQRVTRIEVNGEVLELASAYSAPIDVDVRDVFPPRIPTGLVAVSTAGGNAGLPAIDLSWEPDTEPDLAGYIVYRRVDTGGWQKISPDQPIVEPAFHDTQVQPGRIYRYVVSAIDKGGHESGRSAEAGDTLPAD